jgi:hypothetical protein
MASLGNRTQYAPGQSFYLENPVNYVSFVNNPSNVPGITSNGLILTNSNGNLLVNGNTIGGNPSTWSLYPTLSNKIFMDASNVLSNSGSNLYFDSNLLAYSTDVPSLANWSMFQTLSNKVLMDSSNYISNSGSNLYYNSNLIAFASSIPSLSNWSTFNAISSVNLCNYTLSNTSNIFGLNNINISNSGGVNIVNYADLNITTGNGNRGRLTVTANPGFSNGVQGELRLVANGGSTSVGGVSFATGGLVEITANTPVATSNTLTGAIKLSAASILSYAGPVSPIGSLLGYNFMQGYLGCSIIAGSYSTIPNIPGTVYLYGSSGVRIDNGLYTSNIRNISGFGNLEISTIAYPSFVNISNIGNLTGMLEPITSNGLGILSNISNIYTSNIIMKTTFDGLGTGNISNINGITMSNITGAGSNGTMVGMSNITTSNINVGTINSAAYPPAPSNWSTYAATSSVNMSNFNISNLTRINGNDLYIQCLGDLTDSYSLIPETPYAIEWNSIYTNQMLISNTSIFNRVDNADFQVFQVNVSLNIRSDNTSPVNFYVYSTYDGGANQGKHYTLQPATTNTYVYSIYTVLGFNRPFEIVTICDNSNVQLLYENGITLGITSLPDIPAATLTMYNISSISH